MADDGFQARRREETRKERSAEEKKTTPTSTTLMTRGEEPDEVSPIVPVYISSRENPEQEKLIYAVLDMTTVTAVIN